MSDTNKSIESASCELRVEWRAPKLGERGWCVLATTPADAVREVLAESEELGWIAHHDYTFTRDEYGMLPITIVLVPPPRAVVDHVAVARVGMDAFWAAVANYARDAYGTTTGDLAPDVDIAFQRACEAAVKAWIDENGPGLDQCADCEGSTAPGTPDPHECIPTAGIASTVPPAVGRTLTTISIVLEVEHTAGMDPDDLVDDELDAGTLQDSLSERARDLGYFASVRSASMSVVS